MELLVQDIIFQTMDNLRKAGNATVIESNMLKEWFFYYFQVPSMFQIVNFQVEELENQVHIFRLDLRDLYKSRKCTVLLLEHNLEEKYRIEMNSCLKEEVIVDDVHLFSYHRHSKKVIFDQSIYTYYSLEVQSLNIAVRGKVLYQKFFSSHYEQESFEFLQHPISLTQKEIDFRDYCLRFFDVLLLDTGKVKVKELN
ncbi:MAG: hypothetical protein PUB18_03490 [bacterium]|nr:hypothetical protein [bacterium]